MTPPLRAIAACLLLGLLAPHAALAKESATPLIKAVQLGKLDRVQKELDAGKSDIDAMYQRQNALFMAIVAGNDAIVDLLLAKGARTTLTVRHPETAPDASDQYTTNCLEWAVEHGDSALTAKLLAHGAREGVGQGIMHSAARGGSAAVIQQLMAAGFPVDSRDRFGGTPLHMAAFCFKPEAVQALLLAGAPADVKDESGVTPLMTTMSHATTGKTPAETAANQDGQFDVARVLLAAGADPNACSDYVKPPLGQVTNYYEGQGIVPVPLPHDRRMTALLISKGATYQSYLDWRVRRDQVAVQDAARAKKYEEEARAAQAEYERLEAARLSVSGGNTTSSAPAGSCWCTKRSMRWVPGRHQERGRYEFFDEKVACPCR